MTDRLLKSTVPIQLVIGPRQYGKSILLSHLSAHSFSEITFDVPSNREDYIGHFGWSTNSSVERVFGCAD